MKTLAHYSLNTLILFLIGIGMVGFTVCMLEEAYLGAITSTIYVGIMIAILIRKTHSMKAFIALSVVSFMIQLSNHTFTGINLMIWITIIGIIVGLLKAEKPKVHRILGNQVISPK
jgi:hypothetical protein